MKRLTIRNSDGSVSQPTSSTVAAVFEKLAVYEDAEEQGRMVVLPKPTPDVDFMRIFNLIMADSEGRVIVLPCKVGDTIYILRGDVKNGYETVKKTHVEEVQFRLGCLDKQMKLYPFYYLTRAEAEKALEEEHANES